MIAGKKDSIIPELCKRYRGQAAERLGVATAGEGAETAEGKGSHDLASGAAASRQCVTLAYFGSIKTSPLGPSHQ